MESKDRDDLNAVYMALVRMLMRRVPDTQERRDAVRLVVLSRASAMAAEGASN